MKLSAKSITLWAAGIFAAAILWTMAERRTNNFFERTANPMD